MKSPEKKFEDMTPEEKLQLKERDRLAHIKWLYFIIADKKQSAHKYAHKPKAQAIYLREAQAYQDEVDLLVGYTPIPSKYDSMSKELKDLHDKLINKQIVLVACKKDEVYCDGIKAEIRKIEIEINKQERLEGKKKEIDEIPF